MKRRKWLAGVTCRTGNIMVTKSFYRKTCVLTPQPSFAIMLQAPGLLRYYNHIPQCPTSPHPVWFPPLQSGPSSSWEMDVIPPALALESGEAEKARSAHFPQGLFFSAAKHQSRAGDPVCFTRNCGSQGVQGLDNPKLESPILQKDK